MVYGKQAAGHALPSILSNKHLKSRSVHEHEYLKVNRCQAQEHTNSPPPAPSHSRQHCHYSSALPGGLTHQLTYLLHDY